MNYTSKICSSILPLILCSCSTVQNNAQQKLAIADEVYFQEGKVFYIGSITSQKTETALELFDTHKVNSFFITSPGGNVDSAIQLAYRLHSDKVDVHIGKICASSCANYIVPAAAKVFLSKNSLLLWHGSSYQDDVSRQVLENNENYVHWRKLESDFFSAVGITPLVTVCGIDQVTLMDKTLNMLQIKKLAGFTYSLDDLRKFGMNNLITKDGEWTPDYNYNNMKIVTAQYCANVSWKY